MPGTDDMHGCMIAVQIQNPFQCFTSTNRSQVHNPFPQLQTTNSGKSTKNNINSLPVTSHKTETWLQSNPEPISTIANHQHSSVCGTAMVGSQVESISTVANHQQFKLQTTSVVNMGSSHPLRTWLHDCSPNPEPISMLDKHQQKSSWQPNWTIANHKQERVN